MLTPSAHADSPLEPQAHGIAPIMLAAAKVDQTKLSATKAVLRDLWINHVFWVRNVVVAGIADDVVAQQAAERQVVANAQSIAVSIEPFYGPAVNEQLFTLLAGHYG